MPHWLCVYKHRNFLWPTQKDGDDDDEKPNETKHFVLCISQCDTAFCIIVQWIKLNIEKHRVRTEKYELKIVFERNKKYQMEVENSEIKNFIFFYAKNSRKFLARAH